ncbi:MAG: hypothetical protein IJ828_08030 [Treponema sp.]|nr:hypothetical protein [Treponema sp.]
MYAEDTHMHDSIIILARNSKTTENTFLEKDGDRFLCCTWFGNPYRLENAFSCINTDSTSNIQLLTKYKKSIIGIQSVM